MKHGFAPKRKKRPAVYRRWAAMIQRCTNCNHPFFKNYGGRGIEICKEWRGPDGFKNFLRDMGEPPTEKHTLDRIKNNKGYSRKNCKWSTIQEQQRNRRSNRLITFNGKTFCSAKWAEITGITQSAICRRLKVGWSIEKTLTTALSFLLFFLTSITAYAEPWHFNIMNDWVIPGGLDRYLTNSFEVKKGDYTFHNDIYTPTDKKNSNPPEGDRPFDGYSYFEYQDVKKEGFGQERIIRYRIGALGEYSGSESLQKFIHNDLGAGADPTWAGQNPPEPAIDVIYSKKTREYLQSIFGDSSLTQETGIRAGTVNNSLFLDQEWKKHLFKYVYFYGGIRGDVVLYNTHLDGRIFQHDEYTVERQWFVSSGRAGIELYFPRWKDFFINYGYIYVTEEFEGQRGRHTYGTLTFGTKF